MDRRLRPFAWAGLDLVAAAGIASRSDADLGTGLYGPPSL
jgi:hypothetical protein